MLDTAGATPRHWRCLKNIRNTPVEPKEFRDKWDLTNEQVARLLDLSVSHVNCWFFKQGAARYRVPDEKYKRRLAEINFIWNHLEQIPEHLRKHYSDFKD